MTGILDKTRHTPWSLLNGSPVLKEILDDWSTLLDDRSQPESRYQEFLKNHSSMMFPSRWSGDEIVISGLKLGADHEVDFVIAQSDRSYGFTYTLIEIETPHESVYTQGGDPRSRLTHAIQQTLDWKAWLSEYNDQARRLFPSKRQTIFGTTHFKYLVVMGRRSDQFNEKRNALANQSDIEIRSFDWFTDNILGRKFRSFNGYTSDILAPTHEEDNELSNPFIKAFTDASWRAIVSDAKLRTSHMIGHNVDILRNHLQFNTTRQDKFLNYIAKLPGAPCTPSDDEYWMMEMR